MSRHIFVSYSRKDAEIVRPLAHLLRATNDWVFLDSDSIRAGKKWREEIDNAISHVSLMVVFWCEHAEKSEEVKREYAAALSTEKDVLPVRLDQTPLPDALREFQTLDFYDFAARLGHHGPAIQRSARLMPWRFIGAGGGILALFSILFLLTFRTSTSGNTPGTSGVMWLAILVAVALILLLARRSVPTRPSPMPGPVASSPGARRKTEAEILDQEVRRRLGLVA